MIVHQLVKLETETQNVGLRLSIDTLARVRAYREDEDVQIRLLLMHGGSDISVALRHLVALALEARGEHDPPSWVKGAKLPHTLRISMRMRAALDEALGLFRCHKGVRKNAGISTIIRHLVVTGLNRINREGDVEFSALDGRANQGALMLEVHELKVEIERLKAEVCRISRLIMTGEVSPRAADRLLRKAIGEP